MKKILAGFIAFWGVVMNVAAIEEPTYEVLKRYPQFEIRKYQAYLVAEVVVPGPADKAGNLAFEYLGGYIYGKNKGSKKIEMTAPVSQTPAPIKIEMTAPVSQAAVKVAIWCNSRCQKHLRWQLYPNPIIPK